MTSGGLTGALSSKTLIKIPYRNYFPQAAGDGVFTPPPDF
jgi:hypothetical protein